MPRNESQGSTEDTAQEQGRAPVKYKQEHRQIEVQLTDQEKLAYAKSMTESVTAEQEAVAALEAFRKQQNATISLAQARISSYSQKISTGREYRELPCTLWLDYNKNEAYWTRDDTGEIFHTRPIREEERQEQLAV